MNCIYTPSDNVVPATSRGISVDWRGVKSTDPDQRWNKRSFL